MYVEKEFPTLGIILTTAWSIVSFALWASFIVVLYQVFDMKFIAMPFLPLTLIGTALSFYLGFKNNASYERLSQARKNWQDIINDSRAWASIVNTHIIESDKPEDQDNTIDKIRIIRRHIGWLYAHKFYLRHKNRPWENQGRFADKQRAVLREAFSLKTELVPYLVPYLDAKEIDGVLNTASPASQILHNQVSDLVGLYKRNLFNEAIFLLLQSHLIKFYESQGKNECIKDYPYPRQYSIMLDICIRIFCFLLPCSILTEISKGDQSLIWLTIPFSVVVSWVFLFMKMNSDYSEMPFAGLPYDIPITSITREIEIELLELVGCTGIPDPIGNIDSVLM